MANLSSFITQTVNSPSREPNLISAPSQSSIWTATGLTLSTTSATAELPLAGFSPTAVKFGLTGSTTSAYVDFDVPSALLNTKLQLLWYARASVTTIGSITLSLQSYASAANRTSNTSPTTVTLQTSSVASAAQSFQTTFDAASQQFFRLTLNFPAASGQWYSLAQMVVGPGQVVQGAAISGPTNHTPTLTWSGGTTSTIVTNSTTWYRSGDRMVFNLSIDSLTTATATPTGLDISLPTGYTIGGNSGQRFYGAADCFALLSDRTGAVLQAIQGATAIGLSLGAGVTWATTGSGRGLRGTIEFPIAEWAGSGTVNLGPGAQVEYASNNGTWNGTDSTSFVYGPAGVQMGGNLSSAVRKRVRFQYPIQADDMLIVELSSDGTVWTPASNTSGLAASVYGGGYTTIASGITAGISLERVNSTDVDVLFGQYRDAITADGTSATNWGTIYRWRVRKAKASSPVGFGLAGTDGSSGLYQAGRAPGLVTGAAVPAGMIGEELTSDTGAISTATTGSATFVGHTYTPPAGVYLVSASAQIIDVGTGGVTSLFINTENGSALSIGAGGLVVTAAVNNQLYATSQPVVKSLNGSTAISAYCFIGGTFQNGTDTFRCLIRAVRIA